MKRILELRPSVSRGTPVMLCALLFAIVLLSIVAPSVVSPRNITQTMIWVVLVVGLYTFTGLSGVVSFGQTSFSTVASYVVAWLTLNPFSKSMLMPGLPDFIASQQFSPVLAGALAILAALLFGALASIAVTKLRNDAATIATFAMLVIVYAVAGNWTSMTGGTSSVVGIPVTVGPWRAFAGAVAAIVVAYALQRSRTGLRLQASRDDEVAARASGINVRRAQILAFTISAGVMGLGGVLQACSLGVISYDTFYLEVTFMSLAMLVVGGRNSLTGAVCGALLLSLITILLRDLEHGITIGSMDVHLPNGLQEVLLGALLLLTLTMRRRGLLGLAEIHAGSARR